MRTKKPGRTDQKNSTSFRIQCGFGMRPELRNVQLCHACALSTAIMPLCLNKRSPLRRALIANGLCVNASSPHHLQFLLPSPSGVTGRRHHGLQAGVGEPRDEAPAAELIAVAERGFYFLCLHSLKARSCSRPPGGKDCSAVTGRECSRSLTPD